MEDEEQLLGLKEEKAEKGEEEVENLPNQSKENTPETNRGFEMRTDFKKHERREIVEEEEELNTNNK
jgi:hypothetical protein